MSKKEIKKLEAISNCVYVNPNFDYKKDKYDYNLRYHNDPTLAAISAGIVPTNGIRPLRMKKTRKSVTKSFGKFFANEGKEQLLQKVSNSRKDIMEIKIQFFLLEEHLDQFLGNLDR